jgi:CDP-diglyceride synthetase
MSFQFIRAIKDRIPKNHWLRKYNIDNFDFVFIDGKPFIGGGVRITSSIPILILPLIFNFLLPVSFSYYLFLTLSVFIGDILGSFIKRRFGYTKGRYMPFVDHGDYILFTGFIFTYLKLINYKIFLSALILTYIFHPITCFIGYKFKIKKQIL